MPRILALLIMTIFAVNAGFSVPHRDLLVKHVQQQFENPHKKNSPAAESDADELINETEAEETTESFKKHPGFVTGLTNDSALSFELYYISVATPLLSHLDFILADSEQYLRLRKLLI